MKIFLIISSVALVAFVLGILFDRWMCQRPTKLYGVSHPVNEDAMKARLRGGKPLA